MQTPSAAASHTSIRQTRVPFLGRMRSLLASTTWSLVQVIAVAGNNTCGIEAHAMMQLKLQAKCK